MFLRRKVLIQCHDGVESSVTQLTRSQLPVQVILMYLITQVLRLTISLDDLLQDRMPELSDRYNM